MGKYIQRNSKTARKVSIMDIPSHGGVRTRARTLALQKASSAVSPGAGSYIQLRSRRLVKPTPSNIQKENRVPPKPNKHSCKGAGSSTLNVNSRNSSRSVKKLVHRKDEIRQEIEITDAEDVGIDDEASFGENMLEIEGRERSIRETTPCSLIKDPNTTNTPTSSTKKTYSTNSNLRVQIPPPRLIPTTVEMEEFFTEPEKHQQKLFIEKYIYFKITFLPFCSISFLMRYEIVFVGITLIR
ncbi:cyclin-dependent kinase inhibitor 4 isoform X1 [Lactuca sativa]|uniref:cyclin-dependent kinase inhibitor 4 isoform X1 n=1 Tax=Lactuca sativa TaxID=4236 RepID=UPI000CD83123|nr:cyclin-dependent kinase inhibitor 4 isoform X1 [Lactuca sativa]